MHMMPGQQEIERRLQAVQGSDATSFGELVRLARLDPSKHLRFANWSGIDFSGDDLRGYDFTGANLKGCRFDDALIKGARFDLADVDRSALKMAGDWSVHVGAWQPPATKVTPFRPRDGTIFSDAPFAPEMVALPTGQFLMGSPDAEEGRFENEGPQYEVTIGHRLAVGRFPVTVGEYRDLMEKLDGATPELGPGGGRLPVTDITWHDAEAFCRKLSHRTGREYRLLSEAEWEYACRAGSPNAYPWGATPDHEKANFGNRYKALTPVDRFPANAWGLHDMTGNVYEWCVDHYHESYTGAPVNGEPWLDLSDPVGTLRVVRGGSWDFHARLVRAALRRASAPGYRDDSLGFRCAGVLS